MQTKTTDFFSIITPEHALYMLKRFSKVTGLNSAITSLNGQTVGISHPRIYTNFYKHIKEENLDTVKDHILKKISGPSPIFHVTPSGLNYMGFVIKFKNKPIAILTAEPFFYDLKKPSDDFFIKQAQTNDFNLSSFISALEQVPTLVKNALDRIANNCSNFTEMLTSILENKTEADTFKQKLKTADNMLEVISYTADKFLTQTHLTKEINELLFKVSNIFDIDVAMVCRTFKNNEGKSVLKTYWYHSKDEFFASMQKLTLDGILYKEDFGSYYDRLKLGQQICARPSMFRGKLYEILHEQHVKTILVIPIFSGRTPWGFLFLENIKTQKDYISLHLQTLEHIADIIGSAIKRDYYINLLNKSRKRYKLITQNMSDLVWIMNLNLDITYVSPNSQKILGYSPAEMANLTLKKILRPEKYEYVMSELKNELKKASTEVLNPNYSRSMELEQLHKKGHTVWTEVKISFIRDSNQRPVGLIGTTRDITERKKNQALIRSSNHQIEYTKKSTTGFLAKIAGEIASPLKDLSSLSKQLIEQTSEKNLENISRQIYNNSRNLITLLESIADLTKFKTGRQILDFQQFSLLGLMQEIINDNKSQMAKKEIGLDFNYMANLPIYFKGDPKRVGQIFSNLLTNAMNFTYKNKINVVIEPQKSEKAGLYGVKITVKDSGCGMSKEKQKEVSDLLNEQFSTVNESLNSHTTGLVLTNLLARKMDGYLKFTSVQGKGSAFSALIHLIAVEPKLPNINVAQKTILESSKILLTSYNFSENNIERILKTNFKCEVETAKTATEFLTKSEYESFDIIIMHLPPQLNGIEMAQAIRGGINPTVPIVVLTDKKFQLDRYPGIDDFLTDYKNSEKLKNLLLKWITK
ncbi:MAG TPA: PAS domain S-box protein [Elusimicrobiales bacterium]|nr:PAS domain S-box protein [Elusimicrobiales bacterium]